MGAELGADDAGSGAMKCSFCGHEFREEDGNKGCKGCAMARACHMVKCPNCNYEIPVAPKLKMPEIWRRLTGGIKRKS
jgi:rubredoxin